ncbi:MAG: sporulation protein YtxC [Pelosinus sp.]|nr:sporulation protein YtxC [Pelosinus sp.]
MKLLSVGLSGTTQEIREKLQMDCKTLIKDGYRVAIDEINKGHYTFIGCNVVEGELSFRNYERIKNAVKHHVANMLAELIISREEKKIVYKIVENNYYYFSVEERKTIYDNTLQLLNDNYGVIADFGFGMRCKNIVEKIAEYLNSHHELVLEGFVNFRLKEYREKLATVVDTAVDDYMMELEYKEFIRVLRYFITIQEPQIEEVHVVIVNSGAYKILDDQGNLISNQKLENFVLESSHAINYEDLLITALITIAPYNVMVHVEDRNRVTTQSVVDIIKNIFEDRFMICNGCDFCMKAYEEYLTPTH